MIELSFVSSIVCGRQKGEEMAPVSTKTTYLEMLQSPCLTIPSSNQESVAIERSGKLSATAYRSLYNSVGSDYHWTDRNLLRDDELEAIVQHSLVEIFLLTVKGRQAGFAELDRRCAGQIELAYFGLLPNYIGLGLGKYFLSWIVKQAWSYAPDRLWVHTCDLDHRAALSNYERVGFRVYDEQVLPQHVEDEQA